MPTPITPQFLPGLGLMAQSRRQAGLDQPVDPSLAPPPFPAAPRSPFTPQPLGPQKNQGMLSGRSNLALGQDQPMALRDQATMPSGFDPRADSPWSASFAPGRPANDLEAVLGGLSAASPNPLIQMARMSQQYTPGENPEFHDQQMKGRNAFIDQQLASQRAQQKPIEDALAAQHPAIQGLRQLEAEQKALPQELEAQGRILAAKRQAEGVLGSAQIGADQRSRSAIAGLIGPIMEQYNKAREQTSLDATDPDLQDRAGGNQQNETMMRAFLQFMLNNPDLGY